MKRRLGALSPWIKNSAFDWISFYSKVALSGKEVQFEQYFQDMDRWYAVSTYSPGKGHFITIYTDITDRRKGEDSLRRAYNVLKETQEQLMQTEKMEVVGKLASSVAHEVKNPLAIIQQGLDYLSKTMDGDKENAKVVINFMNEAVNRATVIINDLLDFSRTSDMRTKEENINAVIERSLSLVNSGMKKYDIKLIKNIDISMPKIKLDKNRMEQVFVNILMNSIQAMPHGGSIEITTRQKKDIGKQQKIIVEIMDTGIGIPVSHLEKVFEPFFTTKESGTGTGLGLPIVKSIVEAHGGTVDLRNRKAGEGVHITLEFMV